MQPTVSVIMPSYSSANTIQTAIFSVLSQTMTSWELLIVDDCSPDNTAGIVEEHSRADDRVHLISLTENVGPANARNAGIRAARGKYIAFLDSDDTWEHSKLETQVNSMKLHNAVFSCTSYNVQRDGITTRFINVPPVITANLMLKGSVIGCSTVMYNADVLGKIYFPDLTDLYSYYSKNNKSKRILHEDYALWLTILLKRLPDGSQIRCLGLQKNLTVYHESKSSFSSNKIQAAKSQWIIYRKHLHLSFISSAFNFFCYSFNGVSRRFFSS